MDVTAEIDRLKAELGVELDRDLASQLRIDPSAIAAWKRRGSVPAKYRSQALRMIDEYAGSSMPDTFAVGLREAYMFSLIRIASKRLELSVGFPGALDYETAYYGFRLARLYSFLEKRFRRISDKDALRSQYDRIRTEIENADIAVWVETIQA